MLRRRVPERNLRGLRTCSTGHTEMIDGSQDGPDGLTVSLRHAEGLESGQKTGEAHSRFLLFVNLFRIN